MRIALLEDDPEQSELVRIWLEEAEHSVVEYDRGADFLRAVRRDTFDVFLLDWMLPDISGIEVLRKLRDELDNPTPVMLATARQEERDIVQALETGADDYLVKPVRRRELIARLDALCRRSGHGKADTDAFIAEPYTLDLQHKVARLHGEEIALTNREFDLALFLFRHAGRAVSRAHILEAVWDIDNDNVSTRTVDTHISRLRKKLQLFESNGWKLSAIYQHGYRLEPITANGSSQTKQEGGALSNVKKAN
jgi:DNA-binding response OmpR family regulator